MPESTKPPVLKAPRKKPENPERIWVDRKISDWGRCWFATKKELHHDKTPVEYIRADVARAESEVEKLQGQLITLLECGPDPSQDDDDLEKVWRKWENECNRIRAAIAAARGGEG